MNRDRVIPAALATEVLDDPTAAYVARAQICFNTLQDITGRLAGLLVLSALGRADPAFEAPTLAAVQNAMSETSDRFNSLKPTSRAAHFHHHLSAATALVERSIGRLDDLRDRRSTGRDPLPDLESAWIELKRASRKLPGFETIDFGQACCSFHIG